MAIEVFIQQLEKDMDAKVPSLESSHFRISLEDDIDVEAFMSPTGHYSFTGTIGTCPTQNVEPFLVRIMEANLFGKGTRGAVIGMNEEGNLLTLSQEVDYNNTYRDWKDKLQDFVNVLDFWRKEVINHK